MREEDGESSGRVGEEASGTKGPGDRQDGEKLLSFFSIRTTKTEPVGEKKRKMKEEEEDGPTWRNALSPPPPYLPVRSPRV